MNNFVKELNLAKHVAKKIGTIQLDNYGKILKVIRKDPKELVSNIDLECQQLSYDLLGNGSSYPILSEEVRKHNKTETEYSWIVDPLDGSHNYISGLPIFGVSIALVNINETILGIIYLPFFDNLYHAVKGQGSYLNNSNIKVSNNNTLEKSMITYDNIFHSKFGVMDRFNNLTKNAFTMRIFGSAIYDFSLIANGKIDARIWNNTKMYDFAAGSLIVEEAGGLVTDFSGKRITLESKEIVASNVLVHESIINIINGNYNNEEELSYDKGRN